MKLPSPGSPLRSWAVPVLLLSLTLLLFHGFLAPQGGLVLSKESEDMTADFIGWRQTAFQELAKGHLQLWHPQMLCGAPFFGDFQSAILYPPNWLYLVLPLPFAINAGIALHVFLMGLFTYFWVLARGVRAVSALSAALMAMFGGAYFLHIVPGHLPNLCSMVWIPLVFLSLDAYRRERSMRWVLLGAAVLALQILSGHVQYVYYTVLIGGAYVLLDLPRTEKKASYLLGLAAMGLGACLLSAVQLGAGWDAASDSLRGKKLPIDIVDIADMTPERLWCLLWPDLFGGWKDYWGGGFYWEGATYMSLTGFLLALYAFKVSADPQRKVLGGMALFLTLLAVGKRTPLFLLFYEAFPLFGNFRGVGKLNIFITLFLAVLAASALEGILKDPAKGKGLGGISVWGAVLSLDLAVFLREASSVGAGKLYAKTGGHGPGMISAFLGGAAVLFVLFLLLRVSARRPWALYGIPLLIAVELFCFARNNLPFFDYSHYRASVAPIEEAYRKDPGDYRVLVGNSFALSTSGSDIWGEDPVIPSRYAAFVGMTQHCDPDSAFLQRFTFQEFPPSLGLLRLRYRFGVEDGVLLGQRTAFPQAPRAYLADQWEVLPKEEAIRKAAASPFDGGERVLLEEDPGLPRSRGKGSHRVLVTDRSTEVMEVQAELSKPSVLVITDNYSREWRARPFDPSGPQRYRVLPANGFQRAVPLEAGVHHLVLEYSPLGFRVGKAVSLGALLLFSMLCRRELYRYRLSGRGVKMARGK